MTEFPKIETLYDRDEKFKVITGKFRNRAYGIINPWQFTEKIDGTNIRIMWDGASMRVGGRTDNAQIPAELVQYIYNKIDKETLFGVFQGTPAVIYGEGYGAGIQKGGQYGPDKRFIAFDVLVDGRWWLNWENTCDVCAKIKIDVVPYFGEMSLQDATEFVRAGFQSKLGSHGPAEGLVGRTIEPIFDSRGNRIIVKLKTKDF